MYPWMVIVINNWPHAPPFRFLYVSFVLVVVVGPCVVLVVEVSSVVS